MKTAEKVGFDNSGNLTIQRKFNNDPYLKQVEEIRKSGAGQTGESRLVGRLPMHIVSEWVKEAGLQWSDHEAVKDLIRTKILSGDFDRFRVWEGSY